jgi:ATP-dependent helicase Lhr and Lhr-like helicase
VIYGFAGRNAQQTLGLLVTKQMESQGLAPLGFVATDYATLIWGLDPVTDPAPFSTSKPSARALKPGSPAMP